MVNNLRVLGRWMRMITIPNQSSVPKAWTEFAEDGRMKVCARQVPGSAVFAELPSLRCGRSAVAAKCFV